MSQGSKPVKEFRARGGIRASVWANESEKEGRTFVSHSVTLEKRYRADDGTWRSSGSLFPDDIPKAQLVLAKAYEFCSLKGAENDNN